MNDPSYTVREGTVTDAPNVAKAEQACFGEPWSEQAVTDFLQTPFGHVLVCEADGGFVGYITYTQIVDECQIANVAVLEPFRKKGVGKALLSELCAKMKAGHIRTVMLEVRKSNIPALALYQKCGFEKVGVRKDFYKKPSEDAVLLNKPLV